MQLIARGYAYKEVAAELFISIEDGRDPRLGGAAQAAALVSARADRVGERAPAALAIDAAAVGRRPPAAGMTP